MLIGCIACLRPMSNVESHICRTSTIPFMSLQVLILNTSSNLKLSLLLLVKFAFKSFDNELKFAVRLSWFISIMRNERVVKALAILIRFQFSIARTGFNFFLRWSRWWESNPPIRLTFQCFINFSKPPLPNNLRYKFD